MSTEKTEKQNCTSLHMLCEEDECTYPDCPDGDPTHCGYGLEMMMGKAELRAGLSRDKAEGL